MKSRTWRLADQKIMRRFLPWLLLGLILLWSWRLDGLSRTVPAYGDVLEVTWGLEWYDATFPGPSALFYPQAFHPRGWHVATFAYGPAVFVPLLPLVWLGGPAFAYNVGALLSMGVAYGGMLRLTRRFTRSLLVVTVASLLFTLWGFRWIRAYAHLNLLFGTALLPWMAWALEHGIARSRRSLAWFALTGAIWALAVACALYFIWIGGLLLLGWAATRWRGMAPRRFGLGIAAAVVVGGGLSLPLVILFLRGYRAAAAAPYSIHHLNHWGASLNSLPVPFASHPWLAPVARFLYQGPLDESGLVNLGLVATLLALLASRKVWRERAWRPILMLTAAGLILALGFTLKWDGEPVQTPLLRPLNRALWWIGRQFKPEFFSAPTVPFPFADGVPLPGLLLAALIPFWEGARVLSRFAFAAGVGFSILAARGLLELPPGIVRVALAILLLVEVVPPPADGVPFPPPGHPAFDWLREHAAPDEAVVDLFAPYPETLALPIRGETLWATGLHGLATASGSSGVWPAHTVFLNRWLLAHPDPFSQQELVPILRAYDVDYLLLHAQGQNERQILQGAGADLEHIGCFDPPPGPSPWPYPICLVRVPPPGSPPLDGVLREGWSGPEGWGVWAEGTRSTVDWVAPAAADHRLSWDVFPYCVPGRLQEMAVEVNGVRLANHVWDGCDDWSGDVVVPADLVRIGWNEVAFHWAYAARPADVTGGETPDFRALSVGFSRLEIEER